MKDIIKYYYGIDIIEYNEKDKIIIIRDKYRTYLLKRTYKSENEIINIIDILNKNNFVYYKIKRSTLGNYIIDYKEGKYILIEIWDCNKKVQINLYRKRIGESKVELYNMWRNKIDSFRQKYERNNVKYRNIKELYKYYLGMAENALKMLNRYIEGKEIDVYIQHHRIDKDIIALNYLSVDEMIIDSRSRDVAEYCKKIYFDKELKIEIKDLIKFVTNEKYDEKEMYFMLTRLLYPNYFFDLIEKDNLEYEKIIRNRENFESFIKELIENYFNRFNKELNFWIKK